MRERTEEAWAQALTSTELNKDNMKIAILDYEEGSVLIKEVPKDLQELDNEDIAVHMGLRVPCTEYMIVEEAMLVTIVTGDCTLDITLK